MYYSVSFNIYFLLKKSKKIIKKLKDFDYKDIKINLEIIKFNNPNPLRYPLPFQCFHMS